MTLWHNNEAKIRIKLLLSAQTASLLLLNQSHGSPLRIIILFQSLPREVLVWLHPYLLSHVTWSADLSPSSAHKPIKARERSRRQEDEALESTCAVPLPSQPTETEENHSECTSRAAGPHSDADFLPSDSFADAISSAVWLPWKAPVSTSPSAAAHKYNISCHTGCIYRQETGARPKSKEFPSEATTQLL